MTKYDSGVNMTPAEIVENLNKYIIGHPHAKKAVAVALRDRWRRMQIEENLREEILPKNILLIGSTGIGKTEMARRIAKMAEAPFIKVEATKFTEIGYVGRDVDQIVRDLIEIAIHQTRKTMRREYDTIAKQIARQKVVQILKTQKFEDLTEKEIKEKLNKRELDDVEVEIAYCENGFCNMDLMNNNNMVQLGEWLNKTFNGDKLNYSTMTVDRALEYFQEVEADKLIDQDKVVAEAITNVEQNGIVFIDEIDKICVTSNTKQNTDVSREGVQRDLLPLIEGTTVTTKYGNIKTDHILFIASGAFYIAKPSDMLPELQGRFPIRVEMMPLTEKDFVEILNSTEANLQKQAQALLATEGINLSFAPDAIEEIAKLAAEINNVRENIGARRLYTLMEKILEDISFNAPTIKDKKQIITAKYVKEKVGCLLESEDLSKYIL